MNNSKRAIPLILKHEGGYVDHPKDPGGATNKGITLATFRRYIKPKGTKADLKALTTDQAVIVYKRQYWDTVLGDLLPSGLDYCVADFAVNSGPARAAKYLQKIVGVKQDGKIGPATLKAVEGHDTASIIEFLCDDRMAFLQRLKIWPTFKNGWTRRVSDVRAVSLKWAADTPKAAPAPAERQSGGLLALILGLFGKKSSPKYLGGKK